MAQSSAAERAKWNRYLRRASSRAEQKARAALVREFAKSAENWNAGRHETNVREIISTAYLDVANASYPVAQRMLAGKEARAVDTMKVSWLLRVSEWVVSFAGERARSIAKETQRRVTEALQQAALNGEGQEGGKKRILEAVGSRIGRSRARTIARTEISAAQNMAVVEAAKVSGIEFEQTWCSAEDERTRPSHQAADGQSRKDGEGFDVGGVHLARPGDPNGPANEVINCRCTLLIEPVLAPDGGAILID